MSDKILNIIGEILSWLIIASILIVLGWLFYVFLKYLNFHFVAIAATIGVLSAIALSLIFTYQEIQKRKKEK